MRIGSAGRFGMDIFFVAAGPRYVRRRPGTTAVTAYPPALLLAASRASSITSASMSSMCSPISRAVAARSRPIVGAAAAASDSAPVPPDPSPGMSPRFTSVRHFYGGLGGPPGGIRARGPSCSLVGHDANHWRDFRYTWPAAAAGLRNGNPPSVPRVFPELLARVYQSRVDRDCDTLVQRSAELASAIAY